MAAAPPQKVTLINWSTWDPKVPGSGRDEVPVGKGINAGKGIVHYLEKRLNGKPVYAMPEQFDAMTPESREAARIKAEGVMPAAASKSQVSQVAQLLASMSDADKKAAIAQFAPKAGGGK